MSGFLSPLSMSDTNDLRLFQELRLHPWKSGDKLKIDAQLAMLSVTDPQLASHMTEKYAAKLEAYLAKQEPKSVTITAELSEEVTTKTVATVAVKKKRK